MSLIIPAILTSDKGEFGKMINTCAEFAPYAQIDIMDGEFVPSKSISQEELASYKSPLESELHLMVEDPLSWVDAAKIFGAGRIIFHIEIKKDIGRVIDRIKEAGLSCGIALNPDTSLGSIEPWVDKIDTVLFMAVVPGFYGAKFIPEVLDRIGSFHKRYPDKKIGIDGGVKLSNVKEIYRQGVYYICVGSAIFKAPDPQKAYIQFTQAIKD